MSDIEAGDEPSQPKRVKTSTDDPEEFFTNIKKQIQNEIIKDIIVGSVAVEEWQNKCEIVPGIFIDLLNPDTRDLPLSQSPFGYKGDKLVDLKVRDCKELSLSQCDRRLRMLGQGIVGDGKYCEPYKLVVYEEDGHFDQHTDTPEKGLIKSLVLHLPTECEGGDLMFHSWSPAEHFTANAINYVLFNINHPHRVDRVTKGKKISLLFKVFDLPNRTWRPVINGEYCYSVIDIPETYKNVLFTYPDNEVLENLLERSKLSFVKVYYDYDEPEPLEVFTDISSVDDLDDVGSEGYGFDSLTEDATKYLVENMVDLGEPSTESERYNRHYGYCGNSPYGGSEGPSEELKYFVGYLVNPQPE